jgi:hypothetical protein
VRQIRAIDRSGDVAAITVLRYSHLARLLRMVQLQVRHQLSPGSAAAPDGGPRGDLSDATGRQLTYALIFAVAAEVRALGANFFLFIIPDGDLAAREECCDRDVLHREVASFAKANGIAFIDLGAAIARTRFQGGLFLKHNIHLTKYGHEVAAGAIARDLGLVACRMPSSP